MSSVPSMDAEGITRACTIVPVINKNARATQTQESSSRARRWRKVLDSPAGGCSAALTFADGEPAVMLTPASGFTGPVLVKSSFTALSFAGLLGDLRLREP